MKLPTSVHEIAPDRETLATAEQTAYIEGFKAAAKILGRTDEETIKLFGEMMANQ